MTVCGSEISGIGVCCMVGWCARIAHCLLVRHHRNRSKIVVQYFRTVQINVAGHASLAALPISVLQVSQPMTRATNDVLSATRFEEFAFVPNTHKPRILNGRYAWYSRPQHTDHLTTMSFGWSVGDIVAGLKLLNNIRVALDDCGGASSEYRAETAFLHVLSTTLERVKDLQGAPLDPGINNNIAELIGQVERPVLEFLQDAEKIFEKSLGKTSTRGKMLTAPRKVQWATMVAPRVKDLRERIATPMLAVLIAISQQIL